MTTHNRTIIALLCLCITTSVLSAAHHDQATLLPKTTAEVMADLWQRLGALQAKLNHPIALTTPPTQTTCTKSTSFDESTERKQSE